ncbi:aldo/keto reductase [Neosynechococcus sphagnicola sy1]|uniref:Aldo/keto reductase n=1 Tax=Neosynechococcus sphagnicola sy1 TaxID=1497020 RepID=A0A098TKY2_9CYAN|nr:aldo/keto reductase [Neosynechococcus sphagnicola]KGF72946.1 aldo/keto reductase [Neosynechococcus sphagnicola sy1]
MEPRKLGTTDILITPILMGTWQAGKRGWVGIEDSETVQAIRTAFDCGITTIDTAEVYGEGHSEQMVAAALSTVRNQVVYATKVFPTHLKFDQVLQACDRSLKNLKTDYIDLYQIHWPTGAFGAEIVPISETMTALNTLKQQGKIRAIGVSNFSCEQLAEASQYGRIDSLQPSYSLFWRQVEQASVAYCVEHQISILAYSSLAQGLLTGRFGRGHQFPPEDNRAANKLFQGENMERAQQALEKLRPIAQRHHTTLGNLALAWLIAQPQTQAIVGARAADQVRENALAVTVDLNAEDLAAIDAIGRLVTDPLDDNPVK